MIRIFPDFSVQVTTSAGGGPGAGGAGGGGGGGGMVNGPPVGRVPVPVPGATNGTPQSVQGISAYQQRYVESCRRTTCGISDGHELKMLREKVYGSQREKLFLKCFMAVKLFMFLITDLDFILLKYMQIILKYHQTFMFRYSWASLTQWTFFGFDFMKICRVFFRQSYRNHRLA